MKTPICILSAAFVWAGSVMAYETGAKAVAELKPTKDSKVQGTVLFDQQADGVHVSVDITGLTPGAHGFHIHEKGDCSAPDAASAGGHFNPTGKKHGAPHAAEHHMGDFGNLVADDTGHAKVDLINPDLKFEGPDSIIGRAVIGHAGKDDLKSQPAGNSGARVACGVIEKK